MLGSTILCVVMGMLVFYFTYGHELSSFVKIGDYKAGGNNKQQCLQVFKRIEENLKRQSLTIELQGQTFQYSAEEFEPKINADESLKNLFGGNIKEKISLLIGGYFRSQTRIILPVVEINEEKLNQVLIILDKKFSKLAINPSIKLLDNSIITIPGKDGKILDTAKLEQSIKRSFAEGLHDPIKDGEKQKSFIKNVTTDITEKELEKIDSVLGQSKTRIDKNNLDYISLLSRTFLNTLIPPWEETISWNKGEFSYLTVLKEEGAIVGKNEGYRIFARALYNALLNSGYKKENITLTNDHDMVDVVFRNTRKGPIVIYTELENDMLYIKILGNKKDIAD